MPPKDTRPLDPNELLPGGRLQLTTASGARAGQPITFKPGSELAAFQAFQQQRGFGLDPDFLARELGQAGFVPGITPELLGQKGPEARAAIKSSFGELAQAGGLEEAVRQFNLRQGITGEGREGFLRGLLPPLPEQTEEEQGQQTIGLAQEAGFTGTDFKGAEKFLDQFNTARSRAEEAGIDVSGITTFEQISNALSEAQTGNQPFFTAEGDIVNPDPTQKFQELGDQGFQAPTEEVETSAEQVSEPASGVTASDRFKAQREQEALRQAQQGQLAQGQAVQLAQTNTPKFQYISTTGEIKTISAPNAEEAKRLAPDIAPRSGVQQLPPEKVPTGLPAPAEQQVVPPEVSVQTNTMFSFASSVYGFNSDQAGFNADPASRVQSTYNSVYNAEGGGEATILKIDLLDEIEELENKRDNELRANNDNPWQSEGVRAKRERQISAKWEDRINARTNKLKLYDNIIDNARDQAQFITNNAVSVWDKERRFEQDRLQFWYDAEQDRITNDFNQQKEDQDVAEFEANLEIKLQELELSKDRFGLEQERVGLERQRLFLQQTKPKPATGLERQSLAFFNRAQEAVNDIEAIESDIAKLELGEQVRLEFAPNFLQTEQGRLYNQAQRAFTEARLRKESGAAIPESEFNNDRQTYFAQPGDSPTTIQQKREARQTLLNGMKFASGNAFEEFYGFPPNLNTQAPQLDETANIETLASEKGFDLEGARASGYSEEEIRVFLTQ